MIFFTNACDVHSLCCRDTIFAGNCLDHVGPTTENVPLPQSFPRKKQKLETLVKYWISA